MTTNAVTPAGTIYISKPKPDDEGQFIKFTPKQTEKILFVLHPSLLRYTGIYIFCILTFWMVIPLLLLLFMYYYNNTTKYIITNERIRIIKGLLVRKFIDLEFYKIKEISLIVPFHLKMFGLGTIDMITSDPLMPAISLEAIHKTVQIEELIRFLVAQIRKEKQIQEVDQYKYEKTP